MRGCCVHLKLRTKNYKKYFYCNKAKKTIELDNCKNCVFKEYCQKNEKKQRLRRKIVREVDSSIFPKHFILYGKYGQVIDCYSQKINYYHKHHIFGGPNRNNSEKYGLYVYIDYNSHLDGKKSVHNDEVLQEKLHQYGQRLFESRFPELDFQKIFKRNYI